MRSLSLSPEELSDEALKESLAIKYGTWLDVSSFLNDLDQLENIYSPQNSGIVRNFLYAHPQLVDVLREADIYLKKYFGPEPHVTLQVVRDPEMEGVEELFAYILTSLPVDEALARLDRLDEEWFLDQLDRVDGQFNFNLEFV